MYNHDDGVILFTVFNRDRRTVDKCDMKPHYVLRLLDKLNLVLYYFDDDGGGPKSSKEYSNKFSLSTEHIT